MNPPGDLSFPDVPRTQLEQLLDSLRGQADAVLQAQGRLRGLLKANSMVSSELSLPIVLRRVVEAARDLVGAEYAALGIIGWDGHLEQFVQTGMSEELVAEIGVLPLGEGLLGELINDPTRLRLSDLSRHPGSAGFPAGHPPMRTFLGVPIRIGEEVFGNLYLTEKVGGEQFTVEDEQLTVALAATAGAAVSNARILAESEKRRRWLAAAGGLAPKAMSDDGPPLDLIAQEAMQAADADFAAIVLPLGLAELAVGAVAGLTGAELADVVVPLEGSLAGRVMTTGKSLLLNDYSVADDSLRMRAGVGPVLLVPLATGEKVRGALKLGRLADRPVFTESDMLMAESFANQAAITLELLDARAGQLALAQLEDRERIARDLHDHVIQEIFAAGMSMQALAVAIENKSHAARLLDHSDVLDRVITKIRETIFRLEHRRVHPLGLHARLLEAVDEHAVHLGFVPQLRFGSMPQVELEAALTNDLVAVAREALSNCARHANATAVTVILECPGSEILLEVTDNGSGVGEVTRSSGLSNLRARAERNGGTFALSVPEGGGTRLSWRALVNPATSPQA